jgi:1-aminocyclopropane-1-carboxylate deaminase
LNPKPSITSIPYLSNQFTKIDILRLDAIHPIVSGNKWYKLRYYIQEAFHKQATTIASFGGPYSNHLVALAFAAKEANLKSIGYVRSNEGEPITPTLQEALNYGMELKFLGRSTFQEKKTLLIHPKNKNDGNTIYYINEGGYGVLGAQGAATIMSEATFSYDYIVCAVGTGTMIAGLINASKPSQKIIGITVLKNEGTIYEEINQLVEAPNKPFTLLHTFDQGGYAKTSPAQIEFMNELWDFAQIPTDIVYTSKVLMAVKELVEENYFTSNSKVLVIHSGGLQGNRSLSKGVLKF